MKLHRNNALLISCWLAAFACLFTRQKRGWSCCPCLSTGGIGANAWMLPCTLQEVFLNLNVSWNFIRRNKEWSELEKNLEDWGLFNLLPTYMKTLLKAIVGNLIQEYLEIKCFYLLCNSLKAFVLAYQQRCRSWGSCGFFDICKESSMCLKFCVLFQNISIAVTTNLFSQTLTCLYH